MAWALLLSLLLLRLSCSLTEALGTPGVLQWPPLSSAQAGGSASIFCHSPGLLGLYLKQKWPNNSSTLYFEDGQEPTVDRRFWGRVSFEGRMDNLTITLHDLQPAHSGLYACVAVTSDQELLGAGTLLMVTEAVDPELAAHVCGETWLASLSLSVALAVGLFLLGLGLGATCVLQRSKMQAACWPRAEPSTSVVYEDMSCSRRSTMSTPNHYER